MKKILVILMLAAFFITACTTSPTGNTIFTELEVDTSLMSDMPCHVMNNKIMGNCTEAGVADLQRRMKEMSITTKSTATFLPGEGTDPSMIKDTATLQLRNNQLIKMDAQIIKNEINGTLLTMYGYNGQIPGPLLKVKQGSTLYINFTNNIDLPTTVHWHGLRLENENDGVPNVTQDPIKIGDSFFYKLDFPDEGIYWYHAHVREDIEQDAGLYGNILVEPAMEGYYNKVNREEVLIVDDILIKDNSIVPYGKDHTNFAIMGRFGNVMLVNGRDNYRLYVDTGDVVRFHITNVANVRPFNLSFDGAKIKLVGSDVGNYERDTFVESILITPAERYTVEVLFDEGKIYRILHKTPQKTYVLGTVTAKGSTLKDNSFEFNYLKENEMIIQDIDNFRKYFNQPIDYKINLTIDMPEMIMMDEMHIGEKGMEWEDEMGAMNAESTSETLTWIIRDFESKKENMDIDYNFKTGDKIKIRIFNDPESMHPMQHEIHLHGQRFLVLSQDRKRFDNLVWKDTVNVPIGSFVDILLDITNPGKWMAHCHIAEHMESGMMFVYNVESFI